MNEFLSFYCPPAPMEPWMVVHIVLTILLWCYGIYTTTLQMYKAFKGEVLGEFEGLALAVATICFWPLVLIVKHIIRVSYKSNE